MDVVRPLRGHGRLPVRRPIGGRIVVADKHARVARQVQDATHRTVEDARISAGKIGASAADIRHEQCVADEHHAIHQVRHVGRRVPWHPKRRRFDVTDAEGFSVLEEMIELAAIRQEAALQVVELLEDRLHLADVVANRNAPARLLLDVVGTGEVIGVDVCFQNPLHGQRLRAKVLEHPVGRLGSGAARLEIEVQHRVDDRGQLGHVVRNDITHRARGGIEEGLDAGLGVHGTLLWLQNIDSYYIYLYIVCKSPEVIDPCPPKHSTPTSCALPPGAP